MPPVENTQYYLILRAIIQALIAKLTLEVPIRLRPLPSNISEQRFREEYLPQMYLQKLLQWCQEALCGPKQIPIVALLITY
jgi:hypothetical protein